MTLFLQVQLSLYGDYPMAFDPVVVGLAEHFKDFLTDVHIRMKLLELKEFAIASQIPTSSIVSAVFPISCISRENGINGTTIGK